MRFIGTSPQFDGVADQADRLAKVLSSTLTRYFFLTDPFCRLPLSTLFYRLEAVHLGDLMRL